MIEKLTIKGFQKHKRLILQLDPAITCITGMNDIGKSSVLRALYWLVFNRPNNKSIINWDSKSAMVKAVVDGRTIIRKKGGSNYYSLDGKKFKAFGAGVPSEITELLNMEATNFQGAKEPPFWLSLSPGQVSKELNQIVDLGIIDSSLADVGSKLRKSKAKIEVLEDQLKESRLKRKSLEWTVEASKDFKELMQKEADLRKLSTDIESMSLLIADAQRHKTNILNAVDLLPQAQFLNSSASECQKTALRVKQLQLLIDKHERREEIICQSQESIQVLNSKLSKVKVCPACQGKM